MSQNPSIGIVKPEETTLASEELAAVEKLQKGYQTRLRNAPEHPYDIGPVADRYLEVFTRAIEQGPVS